MESPSLARQSVPADVSEFFKAELDAFVDQNRRTRPGSWSLVVRLQRSCRAESPASSAGLTRSEAALREPLAA